MFNLDTLDTLIAMVIVLLVLSLVVQAVQSALKKLFKIKSRQLEESLVDLFENVLNSKAATKRFRLPTLRLFTRHPSEMAASDVRNVFNAVMREFEEIGRVATSGRRMLDSISKEDLMKVLRKVGPEVLRPKFMDDLETACREIVTLKTALAAIKTEHLSGEANAKFARMQEALMPLVNDVQFFFKADKSFNKDLLLADVLNLREVKTGDVLDLLSGVQKKVGEDLAAAPASQALKELDEGLKEIARAITNLRQQLDAVIVPLRIKLSEVESWYDTVMQSFEERYNRGMKTYAFVISLVVAIWLNANAFTLYGDISTNDAKRASIVQTGESALLRYREQLAEPETLNNPANEQKLKALIETTRADIEGKAADYAKFGFKTWQQEIDSFKGESTTDSIRHVLRMLFGWVIMAALLSIGAPFWHDTLESLFGVKNLLRKRGDIKNVETEAGAGQPQT